MLKIDGQFITLLIAIVSATIAIMRKMATKDDITKLETEMKGRFDKVDSRLDSLKDAKADKSDVNSRLQSIEQYLRLPHPPLAK